MDFSCLCVEAGKPVETGLDVCGGPVVTLVQKYLTIEC